ncbi:hypothetical protein AS159_08240 [Thermotoga sp. Ku-13t]|uniref:ComF family protein n=1 Tax=Thermotoga sp. Ku-13t TaxID=1755813 RepID=UPI0013EC7636|nr:ComF family protein [Thermotoga sp. Ku-13t]KAF2957640.1 hypothetical protein AS159_08240 [Thermotoga sp. Ku-13t]
MRKSLEFLLRTIFPNSCVLCGRAIAPFSVICDECEHELLQGPIPLVEKTKWCEVYFYGRYDSKLRKTILAYKNEGHWRLCRILAKMLIATMDRYKIPCDRLTWVPSSFRSLEERGYDTMGTVAKIVGRSIQLECVSLIESTASSTKRGLTRQQREESVRGAFRLKGKPEGVIALIDDVYTTGATMNECARLLLEAGAQKIVAYCIARA